jgi:hypothetical protein
LPGLTRQSITQKISRTLMDARVKPGHDEFCLSFVFVIRKHTLSSASTPSRSRNAMRPGFAKSFALKGVGNAGCSRTRSRACRKKHAR